MRVVHGLLADHECSIQAAAPYPLASNVIDFQPRNVISKTVNYSIATSKVPLL